MEEIVKELTGPINVLLGALCALLGGLIQSRLSEKRRENRLLAEKLEKAYMLCQEIYDGHKREILNAVKNLPYSSKVFLDQRMHPGKEVSELKMLIRSYAPQLKSKLTELDRGHEPLRKELNELEKKVASGDLDFKPSIVEQNKKWQLNLKKLGHGSNSIKNGIEKILNGLAS